MKLEGCEIREGDKVLNGGADEKTRKNRLLQTPNPRSEADHWPLAPIILLAGTGTAAPLSDNGVCPRYPELRGLLVRASLQR